MYRPLELHFELLRHLVVVLFESNHQFVKWFSVSVWIITDFQQLSVDNAYAKLEFGEIARINTFFQVMKDFFNWLLAKPLVSLLNTLWIAKVMSKRNKSSGRTMRIHCHSHSHHAVAWLLLLLRTLLTKRWLLLWNSRLWSRHWSCWSSHVLGTWLPHLWSWPYTSLLLWFLHSWHFSFFLVLFAPFFLCILFSLHWFFVKMKLFLFSN